ncbi:HlyD family efflux transporter periplasmic adaptor subunit [Leptospira fluminis]|uniref:HlyD family efflux transporter periplasmic adaptor subunit n=1 Tax=Leptospira fluminis TaxID=2484979 RepID=A0A4R9GR29_9LEPT|nr:efflux RND transporter periplasmic adaptor subunit [Leptospira fluminis]TGK19292.1 HlyD family efflux transporter periplasmic adaptor subunit [Leptospira fluminis]
MDRIFSFFRFFSSSKKGKALLGAVIVLVLVFLSTLVWKLGFRGDTVRPKKGPIVELVYALGTVKSDRVYHLKFGIASSVQKLFVKEGDIVSQGAKLLVSDSGTLFQAPFTGTITTFPFQEAEVVMPGISVLTMMDLKKIYVLLSLDQDSMLRIKVGQPAQLSFETLRGIKLAGKVTKVYPSDGQFFVRVDVDEMPDGVLPEMTADVAVEVAKKEEALLIPVSAIQKGRIKIKRSGDTIWVPAKVGAVDGEWCEVLENSVLSTDTVYVQEEK